jgi:hypothetical protein
MFSIKAWWWLHQPKHVTGFIFWKKFLYACAALGKMAVSFAARVRVSVCPSLLWTTWLPLDGFSWICILQAFVKIKQNVWHFPRRSKYIYDSISLNYFWYGGAFRERLRVILLTIMQNTEELDRQYGAKKIRFVHWVMKAEIRIVVTFIVYKYLILLMSLNFQFNLFKYLSICISKRECT